MDRAGVRIELHPLLRQTGEPVQPAAVRWVERAHYLPFLSPAILRSQLAFLRDRRPASALPARVRRHDPGHLAQPELPARRPGDLPEGRPRVAGRCSTRASTTCTAISPTIPRWPAGWCTVWWGSRTASPRTAPTSTSTGRCSPTKVAEAAFVGDDLGRQPGGHRGDLLGGRAVGQGRGHPLRHRPGAFRPTDAHVGTARCGSSRSARSTRSRARST